MNILIFEGIAGSGKTTIEELLAGRLKNARIISENEALMPMINNRDADLARRHLENILDEINEESGATLIFDRFHLTHAFRTESGLADFSDIETRLVELGSTQIILLTVQPDAIRERIEETMKHREGGWTQGARGAETVDGKVAYYTNQQERLIALAKESTLPHLIIDTTDKAWIDYADQISARA